MIETHTIFHINKGHALWQTNCNGSFEIVNRPSVRTVSVTNTFQMNRSWSWWWYWSLRVNVGFLFSLLHLQYQSQQLWDCLYTDAGVLDDNCLAAALRGWNWMFFFLFVAHIVCEALRAGMWETVVIKVFCNSIKDSSLTAPLSFQPWEGGCCYPTPIPSCQSLCKSPWPRQPGAFTV